MAAEANGTLRLLVATGRITVEQSWTATLPLRRGVASPPLVIDVKPASEGLFAGYCVHASGAITLHEPEARPLRAGAGRAAGTLRFRVDTQSTTEPSGRRSILGKVVKFVLLRIAGKMLGRALQILARAWEERVWRKKQVPLGLLRVQLSAQGNFSLEPISGADEFADGPCLLFIHGIFSNFASAFGALESTRDPAGRSAFDHLRDQYGSRVFAFNHFSVSETPIDNAKALVNALPASGAEFDVITHSRGGLVLRAVTDLPATVGAESTRFRLRHAVLVASPNQGTPLASPERWRIASSWIANVLDMLPDNPFTYGAEFVAESLGWLAANAVGNLPGLAAMDPAGPFIEQLRKSNLANQTATSLPDAMVADYEPSASWLARAADVGVDAFFRVANDLVVPTEGGWMLSGDTDDLVVSPQVGAFGRNGNLRASTKDVHHCNFFSQADSVSFIVATLQGKSSQFGRSASEPTFAARSRRATTPPEHLPSELAVRAGSPDASASGIRFESTAPVRARHSYELDEILNLFILSPEAAGLDLGDAKQGNADHNSDDFAKLVAASTKSKFAILIASFRNARVCVPFRTPSGMASKDWEALFGMHRRIKGYVDGDASYAAMPTDIELREFGARLFNTLFPGQVRRLYDAARAELRERHLDVCLTSTIGWVADMPWEFAFDSSRQMFLCMEEVNFLRNVATAVPAESISSRASPLRVLVVAAQPIGAGALSIVEEEAVIKRAFATLTAANLARVDVIAGVTPLMLHQALSLAETEERAYDVLHFIGHGQFDSETGFGSLLFEDADGRSYDLRADHFRQIVARRGIRLVFLNACETGTGFANSGRLDFAQGVAPMLVAGGVPAVVANQFKVLDPSAAAFAQQFYWALATGRTVADAAREARVAVNYSIAGESIDWAVPVLFTRNPTDRLVNASTVAASEGAVTARQARPVQRGRRSAMRRHVAILDVNYCIARLPQIVERLNAVQSYFEFEVAEIATPLGTWRRVKGDQDTVDETYLFAEDVEEKLQTARRRLGVSHLICVTNLPLADRETFDLLSHVNEAGDVSVISTADVLAKLDPPSTSIEQLLSNFVAFALSDLGAHERSPKACIAYYNPDGDVDLMAGHNKICGNCRRQLSAELRAALTAIIDAWS